MINRLSGKQRLWAVIGIAWIVFWAVAILGETGSFVAFFVIGVSPVLLIAAIGWIRAGFRADKNAEELEVEVIKLHLKESIRDAMRRGLSADEAKANAQKFLDRLARDQ